MDSSCDTCSVIDKNIELEKENATLKKSCDNFEQAYEMMKKRVEELEADLAHWKVLKDDEVYIGMGWKERAEQAEVSLKFARDKAEEFGDKWQRTEANLKRLKGAIGEVLDGTLPYLAEKRLKAVLEELEGT